MDLLQPLTFLRDQVRLQNTPDSMLQLRNQRIPSRYCLVRYRLLNLLHRMVFCASPDSCTDCVIVGQLHIQQFHRSCYIMSRKYIHIKLFNAICGYRAQIEGRMAHNSYRQYCREQSLWNVWTTYCRRCGDVICWKLFILILIGIVCISTTNVLSVSLDFLVILFPSDTSARDYIKLYECTQRYVLLTSEVHSLC